MWLLRADRLGELCSHLIHKEPSVKFGAWGQSEKNSNSVQRAGGLTGCRLGVGGGNGHGPESLATGQALSVWVRRAGPSWESLASLSRRAGRCGGEVRVGGVGRVQVLEPDCLALSPSAGGC